MILFADPNAKVMICAPSNASLDEIMDRIDSQGLLAGVLGEQLQTRKVMIRLGRVKQKSREHLNKYTLDSSIEAQTGE